MSQLLVTSVLLLRVEPIELAPSLDGHHLLFDHIHIAVQTSVDATKVGLFDVHSPDVLNEVVEVAAGPLVSLAFLVGHELEVVREDEVRGLVLWPHHHVSQSAQILLLPSMHLPCCSNGLKVSSDVASVESGGLFVLIAQASE